MVTENLKTFQLTCGPINSDQCSPGNMVIRLHKNI